MTHREKRLYLIRALLEEQSRLQVPEIPEGEAEQERLLRGLFNLRPPKPVEEVFLRIQGEYWDEERERRGVTELSALEPVRGSLYLWQGDITTLRVDAIVNAANSQMLGCFYPCHGCIDNAIHTYAGVELRLACARAVQGEEPTGGAKITPAFHLPCRYVLHTVGPIVSGPLTQKYEDQLASCYRSCLGLAWEHGLKSVAFCCISTGEFHFPPRRAAEIAIGTVEEAMKAYRGMKVVFNVFKDDDLRLYRELLRAD